MPPPAERSKPPLSTRGLPEHPELFHDEWITVYTRTLRLDEIDYWPENDRTKFTFKQLEKDRGRY